MAVILAVGTRITTDKVGPVNKTIACGALALVCLSSTANAGWFTDARDDKKCRSWGAVPGTELYIQCRVALEQQRQGDFQQRLDNARRMFEMGQRLVDPPSAQVVQQP